LNLQPGVVLEFVQVVAVISTAVAMTLSLAHALEFPGKLRLSRQEYLAVAPIYYPGFTWAGATEPIAIVAVAVVVALTPFATAAFWLSLAALVAAVTTHALYWVLTAPVNKIWLKDERLTASAQRFFGAEGTTDVHEGSWTVLRDRWERSHVYRSVTAMAAFVLVVIAVVV
jgi:Domain of unknown function (DUF1772)